MKRFLHILAYGYSILLYPLFVPTYIMAFYCYVFDHTVMPLLPGYYAIAIGGTTLFTCLIPLMLLISLKLRGKITDLDVSNRKDRFLPYLYAITSYCCWAFFLYKIKMPNFVLASVITTIVLLLIVTFITRYWKISAHLSSAGGALAMVMGIMLNLGLYSHSLLVVLLVLAWLLMLSRIYLEAHTPLQTVCGFLLGLIMVLIPNLIIFFASAEAGIEFVIPQL